MPIVVTAVVAGVLGAVLGVIGMAAAVPQLAPSAEEVSQTITNQEKPSIYGNR